MAKLIARAPCEFMGRDYRPGDVFEGNEADVTPPNSVESAPVPDPAVERAVREKREQRLAGSAGRRVRNQLRGAPGADDADK